MVERPITLTSTPNDADEGLKGATPSDRAMEHRLDASTPRSADVAYRIEGQVA